MRTTRACFLAALVLLLPMAASGQYAPEQAKTLKGLQKVVVRFAEPNAKIPPATFAEIVNNATLELRKSGIRVVTDSAEFNPQTDGLLNLTVFVTTGLADLVVLRMDIEQLATVVRTRETFRLVTWYHEESSNASSWRTSTPALTMKAVNTFLADWLSANGR